MDLAQVIINGFIQALVIIVVIYFVASILNKNGDVVWYTSDYAKVQANRSVDDNKPILEEQ